MNVITVLPEARIGEWRSICLEGAMNCPQILVEGGLTRYHSVKNALGKVPDDAVVAVHDGVRPMVSVNLIREMLGKMDDCQALIPVVPVVDTLRGKDSGSPSADRESLVAVQTPQFFLSEKIKEAYGQPFDVRFTDDASVVERIGVPISYIEGEKYNFKITTPEDLVVARLILSASCSL